MTLVATLAAVVAAVVGLHYGVPVLAKSYLRRRFLAQIARSDRLCLTFDDGPSPAVTPVLLDVLARAGVKATFCVSGRKADRYPDLIRRMTAEGHQVAAHGYDHRHPWRSCPGTCLADLRRGEAAIARLAGPAAARFMRPPFGKLDLWMLIDLLWRRRVIVYWSADPKDYDADAAEMILARLADRIRPGEVVLLHDGAGGRDRRPEILPDALTVIVAEIARLGIRTATIADALKTSA